jgi:hypothetical protein
MWHARFTTVFLIVVWLLTPDLLCLIPGIEMTLDEHACCERMGSDCGKIPMPDMHTCCRTVTPTNAVMAARLTDYPDQRVSVAPVVVPDLDLFYNNSQPVHWQRFESPTSPPLLARDSFDILRI